MVTVTSPSSNPIPIYNRSGITIDTVIWGPQTSPSQIVRTSGHTCVVVLKSTGVDDQFVKLPSDAEVGDVVEVYCDNAPLVVAPSSLISIIGNTNYNIWGGAGFYRLLSNTSWGHMRSNGG